MRRPLVYITSLLIFFSLFFSSENLEAQFSLQHSNNIVKVAFDDDNHVFMLDSNNDLYQIKGRELVFMQSFPESFQLRQTPKGIIFFDESKVYAFEELKQNELFNVQSQIKDVFYTSGYHVISTASELQFWNVDTSFVCPLSMSFEEKPLAVWMDRGKKLMGSNVGIREVCMDIDFTFVIVKEGIGINSVEHIKYGRAIVGSKNNGIWNFEKESFKQLFVPGISFPDAIKKTITRDDLMWILSEDKDLFLFDETNQLYQKIQGDVDDFSIDRWQTLYINSGKNFIKNIDFVNELLPEIKLEQISILNKPFYHLDEIKIKDDESLNIQLSSIYTPHENVKYQYNLNNQEWVNTVSSFNLSNLETGTHTLEMRGTADDKYFTDPIVLKFKKEGSILNTAWPFLFGGALLLLGLTLFSQSRMSRENKRLQSEKEKMNLQMEILKQTQQFGQLQLNPHFLFNTLNSINGLIALNENKKARKSLNEFSQMMRAVLDNSFKDSISVEEEIQFLEKYLSLEQLIRNEKFSYAINADNKNSRIPPMMVQPFVENAIIHGLKHKEGKGHVSVHFEEDGTYIQVSVKDDGIGRKQAEKYRSEGHESSALKITLDRLKQLDKWNTNKHVTYEDLENPTGTKVVINIPKQ